MTRNRNDGLRKLCDCPRRKWAKCSHPWHFNFKRRGGPAYRFSLDAELGRRIRSKTEAEAEAERIRIAIRAGTYVRTKGHPIAPVTSTGTTLDAFSAIYLTRVSRANGKTTWKDGEIRLGKVCAHRGANGRRLGDYELSQITEDELEAFHASLAGKKSASTRNHYVRLIRAAFKWAAKKGYIPRSPISEDSSLKTTKPAQRARRLSPDEESRLLAGAASVTRGVGMRLQGLIIAALETGCRRGELLGLQWADVNLARKELVIRAENAKDDEARMLPISTRLAGVLEMARTDPAGQKYPPDAYVFGQLGARVLSIKKAWASACKAAKLTDLHFHDLRHEAGSRLLVAGWPLHHVREMLGHASIETTDRYLNAGRMGLHDSMRRFEAARCNPVANSGATEPRLDRNDETAETDNPPIH
jgi:integrase